MKQQSSFRKLLKSKNFWKFHDKMNCSSVYRRLSCQYSNKIISSVSYRSSNLYRLNRRFIELPPYHPKYKKPELVYDLNLDWSKYRGIFYFVPVPPKARPACYIFVTFLALEYFGFVFCHHMMLSD